MPICIYKSDAGKSPKRNQTTFWTRRKLEIKPFYVFGLRVPGEGPLLHAGTWNYSHLEAVNYARPLKNGTWKPNELPMKTEQHTNVRLIVLYYFCCICPHIKPTLSAESLSEKSNVHYTLLRILRPNRTELTINTFTAIVDLSRSNFSIAHAPLFQLKSAT